MNEHNIPEPLIPNEVNLRDFKFMPLDVQRLRDSRLVAIRTAEEALAAILLWSASWHQQPASSLPNDDIELSGLAGYGRGVKEFKRIREGALHGFILCSDDRYYHPVVAEKAAEAWNGRLMLEHRHAVDRIRKDNKDRRDRNEAENLLPAKPVLLSHQEFFGIPCWRRFGPDGIPVEIANHSDGIPAPVGAGAGGSGRPFERDRERDRGKGVETQGTAFALPDWIPQGPWDDYVAMRVTIKKPMTPGARRIAVAKLEQLKALGHGPTAVLNQSTFNSWQGLFEIKANGKAGQHGREQHNAAVGARWAGDPGGSDAPR
jgi:hypothetical protein